MEEYSNFIKEYVIFIGIFLFTVYGGVITYKWCKYFIKSESFDKILFQLSLLWWVLFFVLLLSLITDKHL